MRDTFGHKQQFARRGVIFAAFGFNPGRAGELEIECVEIEISGEGRLRAAYAFDADTLALILEDEL